MPCGYAHPFTCVLQLTATGNKAAVDAKMPWGKRWLERLCLSSLHVFLVGFVVLFFAVPL